MHLFNFNEVNYVEFSTMTEYKNKLNTLHDFACTYKDQLL